MFRSVKRKTKGVVFMSGLLLGLMVISTVSLNNAMIQPPSPPNLAQKNKKHKK